MADPNNPLQLQRDTISSGRGGGSPDSPDIRRRSGSRHSTRPGSRFPRSTSIEKPLISEFQLIKTIGKGTYGRVVQAYHKLTEKYFAIKIMSKQKVFDSKQVKNLLNEKTIMSALRFEFVTRLVFFFQDNSYLYFVLPFLPGGDLYFHLRRFVRFPEPLAKFYISQIVLALEYIHSLELIHRDVKPENIVIDNDGYIKLTDFGFCKRVPGRTYTVCGTPEYFAPELIAGKGYGKAVDWWSMGVMLYELVHGLTPFVQPDVDKTYASIHSGEYKMPSFFSNDLQDLLVRLLQRDPSNRIGNYKRGAKDIRHHPFFNQIPWVDMLSKKPVPPYRPHIKHIYDTSNFHSFDKEEPVYISASNKFGDYFRDFDS